MRENLSKLIEKTFVFKYDLPNSGIGILKTILSTNNDKCFLAKERNDVAEIIYNSIVEYSFNEFDINGKNYEALHAVALRNKLKYNHDAGDDVKIKYGFFGEVLLYSLLMVMFKASPLIARGYFYNPLENSETKGYDSYQLVESGGTTELWFGEVKFHASHTSGISSIMQNIEKALSDSYLENNILEIHNQKNNLNIKGSKIETILNNWENNPSIKIIEEIKKYDIKLIYPILLLFEGNLEDYDNSIKMIPDHIQNNYTNSSFKLSIDYSLFFIIVPLENVKEIKKDVLKWIESKKQLIS